MLSKELLKSRLKVIGEVKAKSPFGYRSRVSAETQFGELLLNPLVHMIAIHTSPEFGGSLDFFTDCVRASRKPLLAKGVHPNDDELYKIVRISYETKILVVDRVPRPVEGIDRGRLIIEPTHPSQLSMLAGYDVCINSRNPLNGKEGAIKLSSVTEPIGKNYVQASKIRSVDDIVERQYMTVLVGEHASEFLRDLKDRLV